MQLLTIMTLLATSLSDAEAPRSLAAEALETALEQVALERSAGRSGGGSLEAGLDLAIEALGPDSEVARELEWLIHGARFEALFSDDQGAAWLSGQLPSLISDLRFEPVGEAALPEGFPDWTPVGEIQIQRYPAYRMARTQSGSTGSMGAFWRLLSHIQGEQIAMTAPVESTYVTDARALSMSNMAFLYGSSRMGQAGSDGSVDVVDIPAQSVVSVGMRGVESPERIRAARQQLERWLGAQPDWVAAGSLRTMGYNSPRVVGEQRYFEVQIPVQSSSERVIDFAAAEESARWSAVDDAVMGGRSSSSVRATGDESCVFGGRLSLENNGGFASVRRELEPGSLSDASMVVLRVRGDGKTYRLRFRTRSGFNVPSYQAEFATVAGEWIDVELALADFQPRWRGRLVRSAATLAAAEVRGIGLQIADEQVGAFSLELASLSAR